MYRISLLISLLTLGLSSHTIAADNVVLITLDGLRWQELFHGLDHTLATHEDYAPQSALILERFWEDDQERRGAALMPFFHEVVMRQGTVIGDRTANSCAQVSNPWYFSYPGYSEILTGVVDPAIDSNGKVPNPQRSFLELLKDRPDFMDRMAAFASWDVFPFIFNVPRSGLFVNAFEKTPAPLDAGEALLNQVMDDMPPRWPTVRNDVFTHYFARNWLQQRQPRVLFISYGETDDFAHEGLYDEYVLAAHRTDRFIREIWETVQSLPDYRDNTVLFITVDHGRGSDPIETWQHHASKASLTGYMQSLAQYEEGIVGSEAVWMAALGPGVPARGVVSTGSDCLTSNRIAATVLQHLGVDYRTLNPEMGAPLEVFLP